MTTTTTTTTTKKMTKAMWFEAIKSMVQTGKMVDDVDGCVAFCEHEIELLKSKAESKKPTKTQAEAEKLMEKMLLILGTSDKGMTVSEVCAEFLRDSGMVLTTQKVSALMKKLVESGQVERGTREKSKSTVFTLVE